METIDERQPTRSCRSPPIGKLDVDIDAELKQFEQEQMRKRLGLEAEQRALASTTMPTRRSPASQRAHTTLLDLGPDRGARPVRPGRAARHRLQGRGDRRARTTTRCSYGKEFGNRGQCNPTYFTVGNLVKYLT